MVHPRAAHSARLEHGERPFRLSLVAVLGALVLLVPWTVRNYVAFHRFVPVANSGAVIAARTTTAPTTAATSAPGRGNAPRSPARRSSLLRSTSPRTRHHRASTTRPAMPRAPYSWRLSGFYASGACTTRITRRSANRPARRWALDLLRDASGRIYGLVALRRRGRRILILIAPAIVTSIAAILGDGPDRLRYDAEVPLIAVAAWSFVLLFGRARRAWPVRRVTVADNDAVRRT